MMKKAFLMILLVIAAGIVCYRSGIFFPGTGNPTVEKEGAGVRGCWNLARSIPESAETDSDLGALPYLAGYNPPPAGSGVIRYQPEKAQPGLNFYLSGHAPAAYLMDMEGNILHRWTIEFEQIGRPAPPGSYRERGFNPETYWRRAYLFPNGDILALFPDLALVRLDLDSRIVWARTGRFHHDFCLNPDGTIYTLTNDTIESHGRLSLAGPLTDNRIALLSPRGEEIRSFSLLEAFLDSDYAPILNAMKKEGDALHANTIEVVGADVGGDSPLKKGLLLVSIREIDTIALIDPDEEKVVWARKGDWKRQHHPTVVANSRLILFDNLGEGGRSKVIEFDPADGRVCWSYRDGEDGILYSQLLGSNHRLDNGNTLIIESCQGRVLEVTPGKEIVWEFINPERAGPDNEFIAVIPDLIRIDPAGLNFHLN